MFMLSECTIQARNSSKSVHCIIVVMNLVTERNRNSIAVYGDSHLHQRRCYFRREDALNLKPCFAKGPCYLRAKMSPEKFSKLRGPMQNCSIDFVAAKQMQTP
ncbi:hypothetical protein DPMN_130444 [Dreissena polymorpha]|uniref:Uncharacterized protein n=1 Tax=Dreissena polymorpha TaxID=45954 RepID=A0A9D4JYE3_DREPO|nr:hypothetical protein DPMN_130444 [Dreissena polymorpha]